MSESLPFTGERFTPECVREIWYEHLHRYALVAPLCKDRRVLDAACGEGYGASLLAGEAGSVVGVDVSPEAVSHASKRYVSQENLSFEQGDCAALPFDDDSFDIVVSFETLEHLEAQEAMMAEFRRVLTPRGFLVISSPDKAIYTDKHGNDNAFHVRELYRDELETLIQSVFPHHRLLGQKLLFQSAVWALDGVESVALQQVQADGIHRNDRVAHEPMYYLAVCASSEECLPTLCRDLWLFDDANESVYTHYLGEIRRNMAAGGIIAERDREIERLKSELEQIRTQRPWYRRIWTRD